MSSYYEKEALDRAIKILNNTDYILALSIDTFHNDMYTIITPEGMGIYESANPFCIEAFVMGLHTGVKSVT